MTKRRWVPVAALGLFLAAAAGADPAGAPLAAPGACAEARDKIGATPDDDALEPEFAVEGSPRHHFTPGDVALGPDGPLTAPEPPGFTRGACDAPLAGCGSILERSGVEVQEPPPGGGDFPGGGQGGGRE
jgi:hypothetical protein